MEHSLGEIIAGNFSRSELIGYLIFHFAFTICFLYITYRVFITQNKYTIFTHTISFLGSWIEERNPKGWKIFTFGMLISGFMFIPLFNNIFSRIIFIFEWGAYIAVILGYIASIGLMLIAIFPDNEDLPFYKNLTWGKLHDTIATVAIGSFALSIFWIGIMNLVNNFTDKIEIDSSIAYAYIIAIVVLSTGIYFLVQWSNMCKNDSSLEAFPGEGIHSFPLWEWILFGLLFMMMIWISLAL